MARPKTNYLKAYRELKALIEHERSTHEALLKEYAQFRDKYDKAVEQGKKNVELLYEQRGVIGFLETKIVKLTEMIDEKKYARK
jgi:hypothetical protein